MEAQQKEQIVTEHLASYFISFSDIDDCGGHLCENGGQCVDGVNEYTCRCADGYDGQYCANSMYIKLKPLKKLITRPL